ncbi:MAG: hypothetical protein Q4G69_13325 [Planctomycetia bacterium]|nr:hypothetical protein [Planctomycetia bacterium]
MARYFFAVLSVLLFACLPGCLKPLPDGMPDLVSFQAKVVQDDKPLEGAHVVFKGEKNHFLVDGVTDSNGIAQMKTQGKFTGIPCDNYRISVEKIVRTPSKYDGIPAPPEEDQKAIDELAKKRAAEYCPTHSYVEAKFGNVKTSGLTVNVDKAGSVDLNVGKPVDNITIPPGTAAKP